MTITPDLERHVRLLRAFNATELAHEQRKAPFARWHHFDRLLRRLEARHEEAQSDRRARYRSESDREAELLPETRAHIAALWDAREEELARERGPHVVEKQGRVITPIPLTPVRREASGR